MIAFKALIAIAFGVVCLRHPKAAVLTCVLGAGVFAAFWGYMILAMYTQTGPYRVGE